MPGRCPLQKDALQVRIDCLLLCATMQCAVDAAFDKFAEASLVVTQASCQDAVHGCSWLSRCSLKSYHKLVNKMTDHVRLLWLHQMPNHHLHPQPHLHTSKDWSALSCLLHLLLIAQHNLLAHTHTHTHISCSTDVTV